MAARLMMVGGWTDIYRKAKELGFDLTLIQRGQDIKPEDVQIVDQLITAPLADKSVLTIIEAIHKDKPFDAVVSFQELGVLNSALIADRLGIMGNPLGPVELTRDKCMMRRHMQKANIPSIPFLEANSVNSIIEFGNNHGWPIMLKPANGVGSIQVHKVDKPEDVEVLYHQILNDPVFHEVATPDFPDAKLIVEKFVTGKEVSVEALTWEGKHTVIGVTDKLIIGDSNFVELGHTMPSEISSTQYQQIVELVESFLASIGHLYGPSHTEVILSEQGPVIIESHTRTGGDRIFEMVELVYGVDMIGETLKGYAGVHNGVRIKENGAAVIRFVQTEEGTVSQVSGVEEAEKIQGVIRVDINVKVGSKLKPSCHSAERPGYVLAVGESRQQAADNVESALRTIKIELE